MVLSSSSLSHPESDGGDWVQGPWWSYYPYTGNGHLPGTLVRRLGVPFQEVTSPEAYTGFEASRDTKDSGWDGRNGLEPWGTCGHERANTPPIYYTVYARPCAFVKCSQLHNLLLWPNYICASFSDDSKNVWPLTTVGEKNQKTPPSRRKKRIPSPTETLEHFVSGTPIFSLGILRVLYFVFQNWDPTQCTVWFMLMMYY